MGGQYYLNANRNQCPTVAATAATAVLPKTSSDADAGIRHLLCAVTTHCVCVCVIPHTMYFWTQCNSGHNVIPDAM